MSLLVRPRKDVPGNFKISLGTVKPFLAQEYGGSTSACVEDLHTVQEPAGTKAFVVVLDADHGQLAWRGGTDNW